MDLSISTFFLQLLEETVQVSLDPIIGLVIFPHFLVLGLHQMKVFLILNQ